MKDTNCLRSEAIAVIALTVCLIASGCGSDVHIAAATPATNSSQSYYDARDVALVGVNPVGNSVAVMVQAGTVLHVFGACYQAGQIDSSLKWQVLMNNLHYVWGPTELRQEAGFDTDIIFYQREDGSVWYKLVGIGRSSTWPDPPSVNGITDGDGPIDTSVSVSFTLQVLGTVSPDSKVVGHSLVAYGGR
jgi:hypothetical protein